MKEIDLSGLDLTAHQEAVIETVVEQYVIKARIKENKRYLEPFNEHDSPNDVAFWRISELKKELGEE